MGAAASSLLTNLFTDNPNATAEEKEAKRNLIATVVAAIAGGTGADGSAAINSAIAAADNNYLTQDQLRKLRKDLDACGSDDDCQKRVRNEARDVSQQQDAELQATCAVNPGSATCMGYRGALMQYANGEGQEFADIQGIGDDWSRSYWANQAFLPPSWVNDSGLEPMPMHPAEFTAMALAHWGKSLDKSVDRYAVWSTPTGVVVAMGLGQAIASRIPGASTITHTGGSWGGASTGAKPSQKVEGSGSPLPTAQPTVASNGLTYQSNPKHTPGQPGNRPNAGIEPQDSIELFGRSIASSKTYGNKEVRFAVDANGDVHRFEGTNGSFHWNGSTGDASNPLRGAQVPSDVQKELGVKLR